MIQHAKKFDVVRLIVFSIVLVLIQIFSSMFQFFPTFVGAFFCYILLEIDKKEQFIYIFLSFLYLSFSELNKGFFLFSYIILFLLFYYVFAERIRGYFTCKNCVLFIYVFVGYIGYFFLNKLIAYALNKPAPSFSLEYFYYMGFDFIICIILFRSKV